MAFVVRPAAPVLFDHLRCNWIAVLYGGFFVLTVASAPDLYVRCKSPYMLMPHYVVAPLGLPAL